MVPLLMRSSPGCTGFHVSPRLQYWLFPSTRQPVLRLPSVYHTTWPAVLRNHATVMQPVHHCNVMCIQSAIIHDVKDNSCNWRQTAPITAFTKWTAHDCTNISAPTNDKYLLLLTNLRISGKILFPARYYKAVITTIGMIWLQFDRNLQNVMTQLYCSCDYRLIGNPGSRCG